MRERGPQARMMSGKIGAHTCAVFAAALVVATVPAVAESGGGAGFAPVEPLYILGIPVDFILFGLTLLGVAVFHHATLYVALAGLAVITAYKLIFTGFKFGLGFGGLAL